MVVGSYEAESANACLCHSLRKRETSASLGSREALGTVMSLNVLYKFCCLAESVC